MSCRRLIFFPAASLVALLIFAPGRVSAGISTHGDTVTPLQDDQLSSSGGECQRDDAPQNTVALFQTNLLMDVLKASTPAVPMQGDRNLQHISGTPPSSVVKSTQEWWPIGAFKASFLTPGSGSADAVSAAAKSGSAAKSGAAAKSAAAAKKRQRVQSGILVALIIGALLVAQRARLASNVIGAVILGALYICASACMISTNKWLMLPGHFPYPLTMTTNHMLVSWLLASGLSRIWPSAFPALQKIEVTWWLCLKFVPIGAAFALSIVCGNAAYEFLSVPFLQVMKQCNIVLVFTLSVLCGLEGLRRCSAVLLFGTLCGTLMAIHGELHFKLFGFALQVVSSLSEATKIIIQMILMSGTYKLDPLTMVLFMAPACLFANVIPFLILEAPKYSEIVTQLHLVLPMIIFNALLAFSLNVIVAQCIKQLSPVGYLLCGIVKDICIIVTSSWYFGESLATQQVAGFILALSGVACYSLYKQNQDCFEDDHLLNGFSRVAQRLFGSQLEASAAKAGVEASQALKGLDPVLKQAEDAPNSGRADLEDKA